ncbi:hypothetical protein PPL_00859 [Heterostelium album PN500]|uniref:Uncharacterized protein n=1 Tax=Heterostelium pallidum (strain ATCC 26659 / Pp 5 / PN500) TaxID=670386 RepID=D3AYU0_HETP5|nr:hypothetical protein PPL_00859 [Heterostelium album PN500]EFA85630.1 hypothetical protein PPL_00859 [Heterostelium album PN500]|eukprot:XP_020437737.1 hypothetical protein PPL_00859 [Heterostelium album PN500]
MSLLVRSYQPINTTKYIKIFLKEALEKKRKKSEYSFFKFNIQASYYIISTFQVRSNINNTKSYLTKLNEQTNIVIEYHINKQASKQPYMSLCLIHIKRKNEIWCVGYCYYCFSYISLHLNFIGINSYHRITHIFVAF